MSATQEMHMPRRHIPIALTIAGSDPSGGAGLQADLKTFHQHEVYGASVVTLLTVQSTQRVARVEVMSPELVREQLEIVLEDLAPQAIKTGALGSRDVVLAIAQVLATQRHGPLIVDPVMISKHGHPLLRDDATQACIESLLPLARLVTPNAPEAEHLLAKLGRPLRIDTVEHAELGARALSEALGVAVLLKGGHVWGEQSTDVLAVDGSLTRYEGRRIETTHTHGTGCTYAAAIAARLARGDSLPDAIGGAKAWLRRAIERAPDIGHGIGPVDHLTPLEGSAPLSDPATRRA